MKFTKMHGIGNDYVYVNCFKEHIDNPAQLAKTISDRHFGVGGDGLILIMPSETADVKMRIFNTDGSEAEMCGNGIRCVAKYTYEHKLAAAGEPLLVPGQQTYNASFNIETGRGILTVGLVINEADTVEKVCVNMGQPILKPEKIPVKLNAKNIIKAPLDVNGQSLLLTAVSMGNPHAVFFCDNVDSVELEKIGPSVENHTMFPKRINVHFVQVISENEFKMRTWERGSGITLACGTGACACAVAAMLTKQCQRTVIAHLPGGDLQLYWAEQDNCVYMTGPAAEVFEGTWQDIK